MKRSSHGGSRPPGSLAVLVVSDRFPEYVSALSEAAHRKGKSVRIHFYGKGVLLAKDTFLRRLEKWAQVTVCRESIVEWRPKGAAPALDDRFLTAASHMAQVVRYCDRHVVF